MLLFPILLQAAASAPSPAPAPEPRASSLPVVQVTATGSARREDEVAAAVTVVELPGALRGGIGVNLSEVLAGVPGLLARERQNFAQDLQVSVRGFGSRSTFGIRGVRLYQDGFPATMPDGQGQVSNFDLGAMARIEVLRGPYSALYGNAAGGVIQAFSARGANDPGARLGIAAGADGAWRTSAAWRGIASGVDVNVGASRFRTDGYREHGRAERDLAQARLQWGDESTRALVLLNALSSPLAQDPLGLTDAQWRADPRQAAPAALQFDTRKALQHRLAGVDMHRESGAHALRLRLHGGTRDVEQFLAVPVGAQTPPSSGGGVVDLDGRFGGVDARWRWRGSLLGGALETVAGVATEVQWQHRRGFENFVGTRTGVRGALRRDQHDRLASRDAYAQADWRATARLGVLLGLRRSLVAFRSRDDFVTAGNPDDSGTLRYASSNPVAGLTYQATPALAWYASWGRGFETPTFDELAYRGDGSAGLNTALRPSRTRSVEAGARGRAGEARWQAALFRADTRDELVVATNAGGRSSFQNAGEARRQGMELSLDAPLAGGWRGQLAATLLDARYRDGFLTCAASPCPVPTQPVPAGTPLPGLPRRQFHASAHWRGERWRLGIAGDAADGVRAANAGDARAPGYAVVSVEAGRSMQAPRGALDAVLRVGNVFDRRYVGSVIVNEANGRHFEPAPGRTLLLLLDWRP